MFAHFLSTYYHIFYKNPQKFAVNIIDVEKQDQISHFQNIVQFSKAYFFFHSFVRQTYLIIAT